MQERDFSSSHSSIVAAIEDEDFYSSSRRLWSAYMIIDKVSSSQFKSRFWPNWLVSSSALVLVVDLGFTTLLTSQVISVAFYCEREKSDKFSSEAPNFGLRFFYVP